MWVDLAKSAEAAAGQGRMKSMIEITKTLSNGKPKSVNVVKDKDGNLLTEETAKRERWKDHFEEILNRPVPDNCINS